MRIFSARSAIIALVYALAYSLTIGVPALSAPQSPSKIDIKQLGPADRGEGARLRAPGPIRQEVESGFDHGTEWSNGGFLPFGRLVTILQDAARGAARPA